MRRPSICFVDACVAGTDQPTPERAQTAIAAWQEAGEPGTLAAWLGLDEAGWRAYMEAESAMVRIVDARRMRGVVRAADAAERRGGRRPAYAR